METGVLVVATKLIPPAPPEDFLPRPRLLEALRAAVTRRVTVVRAAAGYGKTTLLAARGALPPPVVWYSLSPSDADLAVFMAHLTHGMRSVLPRFVLDAESSPPVGSGRAAAARLAGATAAALAGHRAVLVLDDFHTVDRNTAVRHFLNSLIPQLPPTVHLVISTRRRPGLGCLPRLELLGEAGEIGEEDLRFTDQEVRDWLQRACGAGTETATFVEELAPLLAEQTEGWVIGLRLALRSLTAAGSGGLRRPVEGGVSRRRLFDYLAEEVFRGRGTALQAFLVDSSIFSVLSAPLCDAVLGRSDSGALLERAEREGLFLVQLGDASWRYHHLFRDFLSSRLAATPGRAEALHLRAGAYFREANDPVQAMRHLLAGGHHAQAADLVGRMGPGFLQTSRFDTLSAWIGALPDQVLSARPDLLHLQYQVLAAQGHYDRALRWLERAAQAYAATGDALGLVRVIRDRAFHASWRLARNTEAIELCRRGLAMLSPGHRRERADLLRAIALSSLVVAETETATAAYEEAAAIYEELGDRESLMSLLINPGTWLFWMRGRFAEGLASLERARALAEELDSAHGLAECLGGIAIHLVNLGRWQEARLRAEEAVRLSRQVGAVNLQAYNLSFLGWACASGPEPDLATARQHLEASARLAVGERNERIRIGTDWVRVGVLRRLGETRQAVEVGEAALTAAITTGDQWLMASVELSLGAALGEVDRARAESLIRAALERSGGFGSLLDQARAHLWLAALLRETRPQEAAAEAAASLRVCRENAYDFALLEEPALTVPVLLLALCYGEEPAYAASVLGQVGPRALGYFEGSVSSRAPVAGLQPAGPGVSHPPLCIRCLGSFRVARGDRVVGEEQWRRRKPKRLLELIASRPESTVTWDRAVDCLWPGLPYKEARAGLSRALYELRQVLSPASTSAYIVSQQGVLRLRQEAVEWVDVHRFAEHVRVGQAAQKRGDHPQAERCYELADSLYAGDFLAEELYEQWTIPLRDHFRELHAGVLEGLARLRLQAGDCRAAAAHLERLLAVDAAREDVHVLLMTCLSRLGRRRQALAQYAACIAALKEQAGLEPAPATRALLERVLRGEIL